MWGIFTLTHTHRHARERQIAGTPGGRSEAGLTTHAKRQISFANIKEPTTSNVLSAPAIAVTCTSAVTTVMTQEFHSLLIYRCGLSVC